MGRLEQANQLRGLVLSDSYKETIGAWLTELRTQYINEMAYSTSLEEMAVARGAFRVLESLHLRINSLLEEGERLRLKQVEEIKKDSL